VIRQHTSCICWHTDTSSLTTTLLLLLLLLQVCEEPNAMAVASCSSMGQPSLRYVLLKGEQSSHATPAAQHNAAQLLPLPASFLHRTCWLLATAKVQ
jgi:hypothetical protein